jgi:WD40 repeat protein
MQKSFILFLLILAASLIMASCKPQVIVDSPTQVISPAVSLEATSPTEQLKIPPSPSHTSGLDEEPTLPVISSPATPVCFTPVDLTPFAFTPDSKGILIRTSSGVQIFNLETLEDEIIIKAPRLPLAVALSPDGGTLAWSFDDHTIQLVRVADQTLLNTLIGHTDLVYKLRFSPLEDRLVSASHDTWVRIWDRNGDLVDAFQPTGRDDFPSEVLGIGISPDGQTLATIPSDGPLSLWDLDGFNKLADLGGTGGYDTSDAVFSPDGQYVVADLATSLSLWRISDGHSMLEKAINSMAAAFSPDGRFLAYSDFQDDNKVYLTSPDGSQILHLLEGHPGPVWDLFFSPDSTLLASTDGLELRIWQVEGEVLLYVGKAACP